MSLRDNPAEMREYKRAWVAHRREQFFSIKKCCDCGTSRNLQLDHRDPKTKVASVIWSWSEKRRAVEIAKCAIRCERCHRKRHAAEQRKPLIHGTNAGYVDKGCRCKLCTAAATTRKARWRTRTGRH